jgi:hypothetical protein
MVEERHNCGQLCVFRRLFLALAAIAFLSGCALLNPYVHSDRLFDQCYSDTSCEGRQVKTGTDATRPNTATELRFAGDLANAIDDAADQRNLYLRAAGQYAYVRNGGALAAAGLGATALYVGVTQKRPGDLLAALGIGAASALGLSSYFDNRPRQLLYFAGARVIGCVILSFRPLLVTVDEIREFAAARQSLDEAIVAARGVGIVPGNGNTVGGGGYEPAQVGQVMADAQDVAAKARRFATDVDTAGLALREKVIAVVTQLDEQLARTEPDPRSVMQLVGGLGATAGALVPGAKFTPPGQVSRLTAGSFEVNQKINELVAGASRVSLMLENFGRLQSAIDASDACKVPVAEGGISVFPADASVQVEAGNSLRFSVSGGVGMPVGALTGDFPADSFKLVPELGQGVLVMRVDTVAAAAGHEAMLGISDAAHLATHRTLIRAVMPAKREASSTAPAAARPPGSTGGSAALDPRLVAMALRYLGLPETAPIADPAAVDAVRTFQETEGLKRDGVLGPATIGKIESYVRRAAIADVSLKTDTEKAATTGLDPSDDIADARRRLHLYKPAIDGKPTCDVAEHEIDEEFRSALWAFQKERGGPTVPITGTLDEPTIAALQQFSDKCPNDD